MKFKPSTKADEIFRHAVFAAECLEERFIRLPMRVIFKRGKTKGFPKEADCLQNVFI